MRCQSLPELRDTATRSHQIRSAFWRAPKTSVAKLNRRVNRHSPVMAEIRGTTGMMSQAEQGWRVNHGPNNRTHNGQKTAEHQESQMF